MLFRLLRDLISGDAFAPAKARPRRGRKKIHPEEIQALLDRAFGSFQEGDLESADDLCEELLDADPDQMDTLHLLAMVEEAGGNNADALSHLERAVELAPANVEFRAAAGNLCRKLKSFEDARTHLQAAINGDDKHALSHFYLGRLFEESAEPERAEQYFRSAVNLAEAASQPRIALEACRSLAALVPDSLDACVNLARTLNANGFSDEAMATLRKGMGAHGDNPQLLATGGTVCLNQGRWQEALEFISRIFEVEPDNVFAHYGAGLAHKGLGDFASAVSAFDSAVRIAPELRDAYVNRGLTRFELGELDAALEDIRLGAFMHTGAPWNEAASECLEAAVPASSPAYSPVVSRGKLRHDEEQLSYLVERGKLGRRFLDVAKAYETVRMQIAPDTRIRPASPVPVSASSDFLKTFGRTLYLPRSTLGDKPLIDPDLNCADVERRYKSTRPEVVVIDGLLTKEALGVLLTFCREATVWSAIKSGYLGAYLQDGFCSELLLRLAADMRSSLPGILGGLQLQTLWGYKYDERREGIAVHADQAKVNINFWITPDDANLEPDHGGLVVYRHEPPADWGASRYNQGTGEISRFLKTTSGDTVTVPYRQNRAVMFNSKLFHKTDDFHFKNGYDNRRLNITLLFGNEHDKVKPVIA